MFCHKSRAFFFVIHKHSLPITLSPFSLSLDHGGCTCSSCDSNEEPVLQQNPFHSDTHSATLRPPAQRNERERHSFQCLTPHHSTIPPNVCFHIATSNPDTVLICCRAGTRPVISLVLYTSETPCKDGGAAKKPTAGPFFLLLKEF